MSSYKNLFIKSFQINSSIKSIGKKNYKLKKMTLQTEIDKYGTILTSYALNFMKIHNPSLEYKEHYSFVSPLLPQDTLISIIITKTNTNHPYMCFSNINSKIINFFIPFGNGVHQIDFNYLDTSIDNNELNSLEYALLYVFFEQNILIRKNTMLRIDQFSLLNCKNISNCIKKMNEIKKKRISLVKKKELQLHYQKYYQEKAFKFLMKYFNLLDSKEFNEAYLFLKGERGKYFGKERLNTFFKNSKQIIGHLQIFITLYKYKFNLYQKAF